MRRTCAVIYVSNSLENEIPQIASIVADLSSIFKVTVIARSHRGEQVRKTFGDGVEVVNLMLPKLPLFGLMGHAYQYISIVRMVRENLDRTHPSCIYAINLDGLVAVGLRRMLRTPTFYHALEIFSGMTNDILQARAWFFLERRLIPHARLLIVPSIPRFDYFKQNFDVPQQVCVWLNAPSISEMKTLRDSRVEKVLKPEKLRLVYGGALGPDRSITPVVQAMALLRHKGLDVTLSVFTNSNTYVSEVLWPEVERLGLSDMVQIHPYVRDRVEFISKLRDYEYLLASYSSRTLNNRLCAPTKLVDAMIAGVSWLANDVPGTRTWMEEFGGGRVCNLNSAESIAEALMSKPIPRYKLDLEKIIQHQEAVLGIVEGIARVLD